MDEIDFIIESNRIEGIHREPSEREIKEFHRFMDLKKVTIKDLETFVSVYQPNAFLRSNCMVPGVRVGNHIAPASGKNIVVELQDILDQMAKIGAYYTHVAYETLHPFTDGNGRSGRMLWAWQMGWDRLNLGFLHVFYYQALQNSRKDKPINSKDEV